MDNAIDARCLKIAEYIVKNSTTVRMAAKKFGISKSTVHKDVSVRLKTINPKLFEHVRRVLDLNKKERHIRGGIATKKKYKKNI